MNDFKKLNDQELIDSLNTKEITTVAKEDFTLVGGDVLLFINQYKIEPGKQLVHESIIYNLYKHWSKEPLTRIGFFKKFRIYIPNNQKRPHYYNLRKTSLQLSNEVIVFLRDKKKSVSNTKHIKFQFESFISYFNLKPGSTPTDIKVLKYLYGVWTFYKKSKKVNDKDFTELCNLYFTKKMVNNKHCFLLSSNINQVVDMEKQMQILNKHETQKKQKVQD